MNATDRLNRIEASIRDRLLDGDDPAQVSRDTGASTALVQSILILPNVQLMGE